MNAGKLKTFPSPSAAAIALSKQMIIPESEIVTVLITQPPRYRPYRDGSQVRASEPGRSDPRV